MLYKNFYLLIAMIEIRKIFSSSGEISKPILALNDLFYLVQEVQLHEPNNIQSFLLLPYFLVKYLIIFVDPPIMRLSSMIKGIVPLFVATMSGFLSRSTSTLLYLMLSSSSLFRTLLQNWQ